MASTYGAGLSSSCGISFNGSSRWAGARPPGLVRSGSQLVKSSGKPRKMREARTCSKKRERSARPMASSLASAAWPLGDYQASRRPAVIRRLAHRRPTRRSLPPPPQQVSERRRSRLALQRRLAWRRLVKVVLERRLAWQRLVKLASACRPREYRRPRPKLQLECQAHRGSCRRRQVVLCLVVA